MTKSFPNRGKVYPNIVRAWFDTVLNPLLQALDVEQERLDRKDWTWRFIPGGLEEIRVVCAHLDIDARDNLEQFLELHTAVALFVRAHDKNVTLLSDKCEQLQRRLELSPELFSLYKRVTSREALSDIGANLKEIFGAYPRDQHLSLLAQYIVNNTGDLPEYHSTARLWNKHRDEFLAILRHRSIILHSAATNRAGAALLNTVVRLFRLLKDTRLNLSLEHDVPYVATTRLRNGGVL
ncbi:MAG TPA: hypothetical protein VNS63_05865 [Blastocatellia bacterium]|nr:hypothetical protein [Blastocatellia bacterium]